MAKLTGTVEKVFEHRKGKSESGKRWSVQRFKLEADDDESYTCEAWGMRDLEDLEGETVTVTGKMAKETYEGKTYERFKLDAPPKVGGTAKSVRQDDDDDDDPPPAEKKDSWKVHLMRAANLLAKCHEARDAVGLEDGEDGRTLFIEMKRYIKEMPAKPMTDKEEPEPEPERDLPMPPHKPTPDDYGPGPEEDDEIPF
jgi:hypothetical protein